jgi:hypothetical protein
MTPPKWTKDLSQYSANCSHGGTNCHYASPVLVDLTGNGKDEIVVGTNAGYLVVIADNGNSGVILDTFDVAPSLGRPAGSQEIASSPAAADIDNNGYIDIIVGTGGSSDNCATIKHGAMFAFEFRNGKLHLKPGWPKLTQDENNNGCRDTFVGSPAIGNLDGDADLEIVAGSADKRIYAWNPNGSLLPGFPPDSYHKERFPLWDILDGKLADTIHSAPAIVDLNGDGVNEILIGTDEGMFDSRYQGNMGEWADWTCDYALPPGWGGGYCGGALYGLSNTGEILPNFPRYFKEAIFSSPAVADVDQDGELEIFIGQDSFYGNNSPSHPTYGHYLYGLDSQGNELPGWEGGKNLGGYLRAAPALGDITGDGKLEIVIPAMNRKVYAFNANGSLVNGFPMIPDQHRPEFSSAEFARSVILADYDNDGKMEIIINNKWDTTVIDGNGQQLSGNNWPNNSVPIYYSEGSLINSPAVGDTDGDGQLELVTQNTQVRVWNMPNGAEKATWPMEYGTANRSGSGQMPAYLSSNTSSLLMMVDVNDRSKAVASVTIRNLGTETMTWTTSTPNNVSVNPSQGQLGNNAAQDLTITVDANSYGLGFHDLGDIRIDANWNGSPAQGSPNFISVQMIIADTHSVYIPVLMD